MENLNAKRVKSELEGLAEFRTCPEYIKEALALITSQEQRIGAQDMTISELRQRAEKAEHDARRYEQRIKELTEEVESLKQAMEHEHASAMEIFGQWSEKCERLTEENERLRVVADMSDTTLTDALRIVNEFCDARIKRAKTDIVLNFLDFAINKAVVKDRKKRLFVSTEDLGKIAKEMLEGKDDNT